MNLRDMACCGNCKNNGSIAGNGIMREENCRLGNNSEGSWKACDQWEYDNVLEKDRKL